MPCRIAAAHLLVVLILSQVKPPAATAGINEAAVTRLGNALQTRMQRAYVYMTGMQESVCSVQHIWQLLVAFAGFPGWDQVQHTSLVHLQLVVMSSTLNPSGSGLSPC